MDELELLKKDWKRQESTLPHLNTGDFLKMIHKKSSSLTKWILVIAILEFVFWIAFSIFTTGKDELNKIRDLHIYELNIAMTILHYGVLIYFIYWFYKNYKLISTTSNTKTLMRSILKVRKTVNYYVIYNLAMMFVVLIMVFAASAMYDAKFKEVFEKSDTMTIWGTLGAIALFIIVALFLFWLFYKLLYGILLRRLYRNYKELNKLELQD